MKWMVLFLLITVLVAFLLVRLKTRCLGWVIGLLCLIGFLWLLGVLR
jgi:hypothetical protein